MVVVVMWMQAAASRSMLKSTDRSPAIARWQHLTAI